MNYSTLEIYPNSLETPSQSHDDTLTPDIEMITMTALDHMSTNDETIITFLSRMRKCSRLLSLTIADSTLVIVGKITTLNASGK